MLPPCDSIWIVVNSVISHSKKSNIPTNIIIITITFFYFSIVPILSTLTITIAVWSMRKKPNIFVFFFYFILYFIILLFFLFFLFLFFLLSPSFLSLSFLPSFLLFIAYFSFQITSYILCLRSFIVILSNTIPRTLSILTSISLHSSPSLSANSLHH